MSSYRAIRSPKVSLGALVVVCACSAGCWHAPEMTALEQERGLVWMFPGIEGKSWPLEPAYRAIRDAGVQSAVRVFEWERMGGSLANLTDLPGNREKAAHVAREIATYHAQHPDTPVDLVGYSGGGGIALLVVESLARMSGEPDRLVATRPGGSDDLSSAAISQALMAGAPAVRNVVLVQPAVSPDYDLAATLRCIDGEILHYYSTRDWLILGLGTSVFGTIDRKFVASAGKNGFDAAKCVPDEALRRRLVQVEWTFAMAGDGHGGDHVGGLWYGWNKRYVAPYLK